MTADRRVTVYIPGVGWRRCRVRKAQKRQKWCVEWRRPLPAEGWAEQEYGPWETWSCGHSRSTAERKAFTVRNVIAPRMTGVEANVPTRVVEDREGS